MAQPIQVAILSYGMSGRVFHAPLLHTHPDFSVKKVWERTKNRSKGRYPYVDIVRNYSEILEDKEIELVIVNTPDDTHYDFARQALEAGKHVVVEKPFTQYAWQAKHLIDIANKEGLVLSVFQNRRWDGDFLTVQRIVEQQLLGRLVEFESHFDRYRKEVQNNWKEYRSGALYNLGSHMIDQAMVLFGVPRSVWADLGKLRDHAEVEDYYHLALEYPTLKVTLKSSYLIREPGDRYILHGTEGSFRKAGIDPQENALKNGYFPDTPDWGIEPATNWGFLNTQLQGLHFRGQIETLPGNYSAYYTNVFHCIRAGESLMVPPEDAYNGMQVIEAAIQSNESKQNIPLNYS